MFSQIKKYCDDLSDEFDSISMERKAILGKIASYIISKKNAGKPINMVYICTHNSRRSHFGQIWAQVAAHYFNIKNINVFSGGTQATAFNINAINTFERIGFDVKKIDNDVNSIYHISYDEIEKPIVCFSKVYNDTVNPKIEFAAIMTCSDAEENCPFILGVEFRIGTTYDDPKVFDNTPLQDVMYDERSKQIALETFYVFSIIK